MTDARTPRDISAGFPRAYLRPALLVLLADTSSHGYDLLERVRELGLRMAEPGGLYRALRSMDEEGLVESWWEPSEAGPARRLYSITDAGRQSLAAFAAELRGVRWLLDDLLSRLEAIGLGGNARS